MASTPNYDINYKVESEETAALSDLEKTYADMTSQSDKFYQDKIDASKDWEKKQIDLQNQQTDFTIKQINQQKDQAEKDYIKEQSGAYVDWQKQSNAYGAEAEKEASIGMTGTGYSESSQVAMHTAYQNRVAMARDAFARVKLNFDNKITEAKLQNSTILAEIASKAQQEQLELALQGFQYKNQLLLDKVEKKTALKQNYFQRWLAVQDQINTENALAEQVRQHQADMAYKNASLAEQNGSSGGDSLIVKDGSPGAGDKAKVAAEKAAKVAKKAEQSAVKNLSSKGENSKSNEPPINMASVIALGFGPISTSRLIELEDKGVITSYEKNGKLCFKKADKWYKKI